MLSIKKGKQGFASHAVALSSPQVHLRSNINTNRRLSGNINPRRGKQGLTHLPHRSIAVSPTEQYQQQKVRKPCCQSKKGSRFNLLACRSIFSAGSPTEQYRSNRKVKPCCQSEETRFNLLAQWLYLLPRVSPTGAINTNERLNRAVNQKGKARFNLLAALSSPQVHTQGRTPTPIEG